MAFWRAFAKTRTRAFGVSLPTGLILVTWATAPLAFADASDPCPCDDLPGLKAMAPIADLNTQLTDRFASLDGHAFYRAPEQIESYRLQLDMQALRRKLCPKSPSPSFARWKLVLRATTGSNSYDNGASLSDIDAIYTDLRYAGFDIGKMTLAQTEGAVASLGYAGSAVPAGVLLKTYFRPSGQSFDDAFRQNAKGLSPQQVVQVAQYVGYLAGNRYDSGKENSVNRPIVPNGQVYAASFASLTGGDPNLNAGLCADVANAQGHILELGGLKNVVVATWSTPGGLHTTVIAQDPNAKSTYYKLNYELEANAKNKEGAALLQTPGGDQTFTNSGINYYLNKPNGATVAYVPTDFGKIMSEAAGFDVHDIEPLARTTSSLVGAQLQLSGNRSAQLFLGRDTSGNLYAGAGVNQAWGQGSHFPGAAGLVLGARHTVEGVDLGDLYLQIEQRAKTSDIHVTKELKARIDAALIVMGSYSLPMNNGSLSSDNELGASAGVLLNTGAQIGAGGPDSKVSWKARVDAQTGVGLKNIAGATPMPYLNDLMFSAEGRAKLGETRFGRAYLVAATAVLLDYFGPRLQVRVGAETPKVGVRLQVTGRLAGDTPTYKDGSLRRASVAAGYSINSFLRVSVMGETTLEPGYVVPTVSGVLDGRF